MDKGAIQKAHNVESQSLDIFFCERNVGPVRQLFKIFKSLCQHLINIPVLSMHWLAVALIRQLLGHDAFCNGSLCFVPKLNDKLLFIEMVGNTLQYILIRLSTLKIRNLLLFFSMDHPVTFTGATLPETQPLDTADQLLFFILLSYIYFYVLDQAQHLIHPGNALGHFATLLA